MAEIKLHEFTETLYDIVGDKIREFCEKTYYGYIVFSFEQSYDGKEWTKEVEFAGFENCIDLYYETDWNEGQRYLRNLRIWHLEDSEPVKHACDLTDKARYFYCSECGYAVADVFEGAYRHDERVLIFEKGKSWNYCPNCGARMDGGEK